MKDPQRLKYGTGAARELLGSISLPRADDASRRRALAIAHGLTGVAVTGGAAAASAAPLVKSVVFWICVGAAGGGTASLVASRFTAPSVAPPRAAMPVPSLRPPVQPAAPTPPTTAAPVAIPSPSAASPGAPSQRTEPQPEAEGPRPTPSRGSFADAAGSKPTLFEELRLIEAARAATSSGSASAALDVLDAYDRAYPAGQFQSEALALRIEALSRHGENARARALLSELERRYPQHPLLPRAKRAVEQ